MSDINNPPQSNDDALDTTQAEQEAAARIMRNLPPTIVTALQAGDLERYEAALAQLPSETQQAVQDQVSTLAGQLGYDQQQVDRKQLLAAMPSAVQDAINSGNASTLTEALRQLSEAEANAVIQQLQATGIIGLRGPSDEQVAKLLDSLPRTTRDALESGDSIAFEAALSQLPEAEAETTAKQLQAAGIIGSPTPSNVDMDSIRTEFEPLLHDIAAVAQGNNEPRAELNVLLPQLEAQGWQLSEVARRIWAGERNAEALTANIDENSAILIRRVLEIIAAPPLDQLLAELPPAIASALQSGDPQQFANALEQLPPGVQQSILSQMHSLAAQLGYNKPQNNEP